MSRSGFSGNQIAVAFQRLSPMTASPSRKTLAFYSTTLKKPLYNECISRFHIHFMNKTNFLNQNESVSSEGMIKYLNDYCSSLIEELLVVQRKSNESSTDQVFKEMALILRTIQSFLLSSTISNSIIKLNREYAGEQRLIETQNFDIELFFKCIMLGNLEDAIKVLRKHRNYSSTQGFHIESCLNAANRIFGLVYFNDNEFLSHFEMISLESQRLLKICESSDPDLKKISKIIAGNTEEFMMLKPHWLEYLIYHCLFLEGIVYNTQEIAETLLKKFTLIDFDRLLIKVMFGNLHEFVQNASNYYPSFFISHVVDILSCVGKLPANARPEFEELNYPEYYFYNYVSEILPIVEIPVEITCDYINYNLGNLENCGEIMKKAAALRIPNENIDKMVNYFKGLGFLEISDFIHKIKAMESLQKNRFGESLHWAILSGVPELRYRIEKHIIDFACNDLKNCIHFILETIPNEVRSESSLVIFFLQYVNFVNAIQQSDIRKAGEMLINFFLQETSPEEFYECILIDACDLFDKGLVLSYSNFMTLLRAYEKTCNKGLRKHEVSAEIIQKLSGKMALAASLSLSMKN